MRVVIGEDHLLTREGITRLLESLGHVVLAQAASLPELLKAVRAAAPDVVVTDIRMPPSHSDEGLVAAATIHAERPGTGVLLLSQFVEPGYALGLLRGGGTHIGYLLKDRLLQPDTLDSALRRVAAGGCVIDPWLVDQLLSSRGLRDPLDMLTPREREVLALVAQGHTNAGIAADLVISERTVEVHVQQVFMKLGLPNDPGVNRRVLAVLAFLQAQPAPDIGAL